MASKVRHITILTATYNRPKELARSVESIKKALSRKSKYDVKHSVLYDGEEVKLIDMVGGRRLKNYWVYHMLQYPHNGRVKYWDTLNFLMQNMGKTKPDYILFQPDDFVVCDNYFDKLFEVYDKLPQPCALNDFHRGNTINPTRRYPLPGMDGAFIVPYEVLKAIDFTIPDATKQAKAATHGSFAWVNFTNKVYEVMPEFKVFTTNHSLRRHIGGKSVMNPGRPFHIQESQVTHSEPLDIINTWRGINCTDHNRDDDRYLFVVKHGLGNMIEMLPTYFLLCRAHPNLDICYYGDMPESFKLMEIIAEYMGNGAYSDTVDSPIDPRDYKGQFVMLGSGIPGIDRMNKATNLIKNEVSAYMDSIQAHHPDTSCTGRLRLRQITPINWEHFAKPFDVPKYDVVICDGGTPNVKWKRKKYQRWNEVAKKLRKKGYTVASVGNEDEVVPAADNYTLADIEATFNLVSNCRVFASNDTGLYHFANLIGKKNVVVFTATNIQKNWNAIFHRFSTVISSGMACSPCQGTVESLWCPGPGWDVCTEWKCAKFAPGVIVKSVEEILNE